MLKKLLLGTILIGHSLVAGDINIAVAANVSYAIDELKKADLEISGENIFIAAACQEKGIAFLKGDGELNVRKISEMKKDCEESSMGNGNYTVVVDGQKFSVQVAQGDVDIQVVAPVATATPTQAVAPVATSGSGTEVGATVNGNVWKILVSVGDKVEKGHVIAILEAMKSAGSISAELKVI